MSLITAQDAQLTAAAAVGAHAFFAHYEPRPQLVLLAYAAGSSVLMYHFVASRGASIAAGLTSAWALTTLFTTTLFLSIGVYRLFFHRLRAFPGPFKARLSKWLLVPVDVAGERPRYIHKLHKKYGDVVRTGPRELSVNNAAAINVMLGASTPAIKGTWYEGVHAGLGKRSLSLHATVDTHDHTARRRIWDKGFSTKALKSYEPLLRKLTTELMLRFEENVGKEIRIDDWCMFYGFDVMSTIGFGSNTDLIGKGELSKPIHLLEKAMEMFNVVGNVPYMAHLARYLPNPVADFEAHTQSALDERIHRGAGEPDLLAYLLETDKESGWKHTMKELNSDCGLIIVAGSDTTSLALAMTIFELTRNPDKRAKLAQELDTVFGDEPAEDFDRLNKDCPYLNAVVNETMRLHPPVMSGVQRMTPAEGLAIGETFIPGNTIVTIPTYSLHRDARNFAPGPEDWRPERWLDPKKEEAFNIKAFNPFSFGPTGCVGSGLARMELRSVIASFAQLFDAEFAPGFDAATYPAKLLDTFTVKRAEPIRVTLSKRKGGKRLGA